MNSVKLNQLFVAVAGSAKIVCQLDNKKETVLLDSPKKGLLLKPMVWHTIEDFSSDCVLLVLVDNIYVASDYIRDYQQFLQEK